MNIAPCRFHGTIQEQNQPSISLEEDASVDTTSYRP